MSTAPQAAGSQWNANNWHWEEKNFTKFSTDFLIEKFPLKGNVVEFLNPEKLTGEASVSVRKQTGISVFEFCIKGKWKTNDNSGSYSIPSIDHESEEDFEFQVSADKDLDLTTRRTIIGEGRKLFTSLMEELSLALVSEISAVDSIQKDKETRAIEKIKTEEAKLATVQQQDKLLSEQKKIDENQFSQSGKNTTSGSEWNVHSYHWEEINLTKFALAEIQKVFTSESSSLKINDLEKYSDKYFVIEFCNIAASGEAASSVRKSKLLLVFDMKCGGYVNASLRLKSDNSVVADLKSQFSIPELSSETIQTRDLNDINIDRFIKGTTGTPEDTDAIESILKSCLKNHILDRLEVFRDACLEKCKK